MPLTPQARAFLDAIEEKNPPPWEQLSPQEGRELFNSFDDLFGEGPQLARVEDQRLPGGVGVRVYSDSDASQPVQPVVMYFHGGGWVLGNVQTHDALCRRIARFAACSVISVDYALAPEHPYPRPLDDCYGATEYVATHGDDFGIDPDRLAVAGDSAGANLAAAVALKSRDTGGPKIKLQVLIYPVIEPNFESASYREMAEGFSLTRSSMQWFWQQYMDGQEADSYAVPSKAPSLRGLPQTHLITAEYDVLRDEGEAFARRLQQADVPTTFKRYAGNLHGFVSFAAAFDDGLAATQDIAEVLRSQLV